MKPFAEKFYKSKAWQQCRYGYIQSVHGLCERCLKKGIYKPGKIVHHKTTLTPANINNPEIALNWERLEYCCQDCHNLEHHGSEVTAEGTYFDEEGNLVRSE